MMKVDEQVTEQVMGQVTEQVREREEVPEEMKGFVEVVEEPYMDVKVQSMPPRQKANHLTVG